MHGYQGNLVIHGQKFPEFYSPVVPARIQNLFFSRVLLALRPGVASSTLKKYLLIEIQELQRSSSTHRTIHGNCDLQSTTFFVMIFTDNLMKRSSAVIAPCEQCVCATSAQLESLSSGYLNRSAVLCTTELNTTRLDLSIPVVLVPASCIPSILRKMTFIF